MCSIRNNDLFFTTLYDDGWKNTKSSCYNLCVVIKKKTTPYIYAYVYRVVILYLMCGPGQVYDNGIDERKPSMFSAVSPPPTSIFPVKLAPVFVGQIIIRNFFYWWIEMIKFRLNFTDFSKKNTMLWWVDGVFFLKLIHLCKPSKWSQEDNILHCIIYVGSIEGLNLESFNYHSSKLSLYGSKNLANYFTYIDEISFSDS